MTHKEYMQIMFLRGYEDGLDHLPMKYADDEFYAVGYAFGESQDES